MNYSQRLASLVAALSESCLDGVVYSTGPNLFYFCGYPVTWQREQEPTEPDCLLVIGRESEPKLIVASPNATYQVPLGVEVAADRTQLLDCLAASLAGSRFGISQKAEAYLSELLAEAVPGATCVPADFLGDELRYQKEPAEVELLRKAAELNDQVMARVVPMIRPGVTQPQLQQLIADIGRELGAEDVSFPPAALFVKTGSEPSPNPFTYPKEEGLVPGTSIAFDFGFVLNGYCSDFGRSFYCGPAPDHISGAYRALQDAHCHLISRMRPGVRIGDLFSILEARLDELGYGDRLRARLANGTLGHQIGVDLHESPWIKPSCDMLLKPGMVMALEPKVWLPGDYYLRVEDIVLITETGAESFNKFDRQLFELPL